MVSEPQSKYRSSCTAFQKRFGASTDGSIQYRTCTLKRVINIFRASVLSMQLAGLNFENSSLHGLPVEVASESKHVEPQRQVKGACWSRVKPEPLKSPALVAASLPCLALLDLGSTQVRSLSRYSLHESDFFTVSTLFCLSGARA